MDNVSLGGKLAYLREQMGLTQDDIANKIHVRKTIIDDIEKEQLIRTSFVFVKGYIRSYAELVGLSVEEYQPYLDELSHHYQSYKMKNYSQNYKKKHGKKIFLMIVLVFLCALGVTLYYVNKENKSNLVEVSHYISPSLSKHVNS